MMNLKIRWLAGSLLLCSLFGGCGGDGPTMSTQESDKKMQEDMQKMQGMIPQEAGTGTPPSGTAPPAGTPSGSN
jgi:hypothetical protein